MGFTFIIIHVCFRYYIPPIVTCCYNAYTLLLSESFKNMQILFRQVSLEGFTDSPETTIHERLGNVTYVLPVPTNTRYISLVLRDLTKHFVVCELIVYGGEVSFVITLIDIS